MTNYELRSLEKGLRLLAGFLTEGEKFSLVVRIDNETSCWNHKTLRIMIGLKGAEGKENDIGELLTKHEAGHVLYTSRILDYKKLPFPFPILNILEDARIESLMDTDFGPLHDHSYDTYYLKNTEDDGKFSAPCNIGILLRWRKWGVDTMTEKPEDLSHEEYKEFLTDWQEAIDKSILGQKTEDVVDIGEALYLKWKELFDKSNAGQQFALGRIEDSANDAMGAGEIDETDEYGMSTGNDADTANDIALYFGEEWFAWDKGYIEDQARKLRALLEIKSTEEREFRLSGRRFDPRRIENPPLAPFRHKVESRGVFCMKRLLVSLDGSGSMQGEPFRNACHIAYVLSLVFPVDIFITTNLSGEKPIKVPLRQIDLLQGFSAWGGSENYISLDRIPMGYSFTLFLTDANVCQEDQDYVEETLSKTAKIGAGYVGACSNRLVEVFPRNFCSQDLDRDVARMVALFLKRHFTQQITS